MQLALGVGLVVGACAPLVGAFLVDRHLSLLGDGIGHLAFAGVAAGLLLSISPIWTALVVAVVGAVLVEWLRTRGKASGDLALALFFYGGIAAGAVLASRAATNGITVNIVPYLFGSILTVTDDRPRARRRDRRGDRADRARSPTARGSRSGSTRSRRG